MRRGGQGPPDGRPPLLLARPLRVAPLELREARLEGPLVDDLGLREVKAVLWVFFLGGGKGEGGPAFLWMSFFPPTALFLRPLLPRREDSLDMLPSHDGLHLLRVGLHEHDLDEVPRGGLSSSSSSSSSSSRSSSSGGGGGGGRGGGRLLG